MSVRLKFLSACTEVFTMTTNVTDSHLDGQWLDFYALLDVPVGADEDVIRRRIGRVYSEACANAEHRDLKLRHYYQSLVERVLPQARRVLLDAGWRAKYDRQHILHSIGDPTAQPFVAFIAAMRGGEISNLPGSDLTQLPSRIQDEIIAAREVVECARAGLQLELLPSQAIQMTSGPAVETKARANSRSTQKQQHEANGEIPTKRGVATRREVPAPEAPVSRPATREPEAPTKQEEQEAPASRVLRPRVPAPLETQKGEPVRVQTLTIQQARDIRRRSAGADAEPFVSPETLHEKIGGDVMLPPRHAKKAKSSSRVSVGDSRDNKKRILSPTSLHLLVAITGVLLTISIQKFAATPASATSAGRVPILVAAAPEMAGVLGRVKTSWERTPEGQNFDLVVLGSEGESGVRRVLGHGGSTPDVWMPSSKTWLDRYNALAPGAKREPLSASEAVASTPVVLLARGEHAGELRRLFPDHRIASWNALRQAVATGATGKLGLSDPQGTAVGALARFSMLREWGESHGQTPASAVKSAAFWEWMKGFETNTPSAYGTTNDMVNDLLAGDSSRIWWGLAYESDALAAMRAGQNIEVWYLPRTILADHPFYEVERVGAPVEVGAARATFERFLRSDEGQKNLLLAGMRPTRVALNTPLKGNPFRDASFQARGLRASLPRDERSGAGLLNSLSGEWAKRYK